VITPVNKPRNGRVGCETGGAKRRKRRLVLQQGREVRKHMITRLVHGYHGKTAKEWGRWVKNPDNKREGENGAILDWGLDI